MVNYSNEAIRDSVVKHLIKNNLSITCMESCTSGLVSSMLTDTEGASAIFPGSVVTYSNSSKILSKVDPGVIEKYGVYSKETACAMAESAQKIYQTDIAIGVTGSTGNVDPNNKDSIAGEVHYAIIHKDKLEVFSFKADVSSLTRKEIKQLYAEEIFKTLAKLLKIL